MQDEEKSRLDRLEENLYSRKHENPSPHERSPISQPEFDVNKDWSGQDEPLAKMLERQMTNSASSSNPFNKILLGSIIFFLLALGIAAYMFFVGGNTVSSDKIDIAIVGPTSIAAGEELSLEILIRNNNNVDLEGVNMLVEYPPGSRVAGNTQEELVRQREVVGRVPSGGEGRKTVKAVLFGEKESIQNIKITLEYRIRGSNAIFFKDKLYELTIKSSPVIVTVDGPEEVNAGQNVEFTIAVSSNTTEVIDNLLLSAEYPFGFTFVSSQPAPIDNGTVWRIGDLSPSETREITIVGSIQGQNEEERTFRFNTGIASERSEEEIGVNIVSLIHPLRIARPFIDLVLTINGDSSAEYIAEPGKEMQMNIVWSNNLPSRLLNSRIEAKLSGSPLDRNSISVRNGGFYNSSSNTVVWDRSNNPEFADIGPGQKGVVSFSFSPASNISGSQSQEIKVDVSMSGSQVLPSGPPQTVVSTEDKLVKLASSLNLTARLVHSVGSIENIGPIPPKAETETTYTVIWNITNTLNAVSNATVKTTLPSYVSWTGEISPGSADITYDSVTREVSWDVGEIRAGAGFDSSPLEAQFQVSFIPSLSQVGSTPVIITNSTLSGEDKFTSQPLSSSRSSLTTRLSTDPAFETGDDLVVK